MQPLNNYVIIKPFVKESMLDMPEDNGVNQADKGIIIHTQLSALTTNRSDINLMDFINPGDLVYFKNFNTFTFPDGTIAVPSINLVAKE